MKLSAQTMPSQLRRGRLAPLLVVIFGAAAAYEAAEMIVAGQTFKIAITGLVLLACAAVVVILNSWQRGLYIFLGWLLFEDFVRKYLGNNMGIYFAKDALVLVVYLSFFMAWRAKKVQTFRPPFLFAAGCFFWFGVIQIFNPASTSVFYGFLGIKLYFLYVPLVLVGYALINSEEDLRRFFFFCSVLIIGIAGLGIAQAIIGPSFLNPATLQNDIRELGSLYRVAPISGEMAYRPTSVFVSNGRFQDFLIVSWLMSLGFGGYLILRSRKGRILAFGTIAVVAAASFMSASRGVLMWNLGSGLVVVAAFLWGAPWKRREAIRAVKAVQRILLVVGLALFGLVLAFPNAFGARLAVYSETLLPSSTASELTYRAQTYPLRNFLLAFEHPRWPYGYGIGTASLGMQYVTRIMHAEPMEIAVENGYGNLVVEMGIGGLILWIFLGAAVCIAAWKVVKRLKGSPWFPLGFVIFWYAFLLMFPMGYQSMVAYEDFVMNSFLWVLLGVLFRLPSVATSSQFAAGAVSGQESRRRWVV